MAKTRVPLKWTDDDLRRLLNDIELDLGAPIDNSGPIWASDDPNDQIADEWEPAPPAYGLAIFGFALVGVVTWYSVALWFF